MELERKPRIIALAGNPNVGKSTVFNQLTGLNQHTGNWPGKTVSNARGKCIYKEREYTLVDIPGCYSLMAHSQEEEVARDFICFEQPDGVAVVCDGTCLERNFNLVLQVIEACKNVVVCINMMDEVKEKKIHIDFTGLSKELKVPVMGITGRNKKCLDQIFENMESVMEQDHIPEQIVRYPDYVEEGIEQIENMLSASDKIPANTRWLAARLLDSDESLGNSMENYLGGDLLNNKQMKRILEAFENKREERGISKKMMNDEIADAFIGKSSAIYQKYISCENRTYHSRDRRLDRLFTSKLTGFPIMFLVLMFIFWLTVSGANYPSRALSAVFFWVEGLLANFFDFVHIPSVIKEAVVFGMFRMLAWVISVMLPPMAIFFPLFTLLEDFGYLPRVAFNLDKCFQCCHACGKQALTTCMGFGCNAAGIIGCRIIDSPRERLIAMITNNFVPCNGRIPILISIITMFFAGNMIGGGNSILSALLLAGMIIFSILMSLAASAILSKTVLKGVPSSFTLELPPYRRPQVRRILVHSIFDRTLFVLGRAAVIAAPAGLIIWLLANIRIYDLTVLRLISDFLDPFARIFGMDGVILLAFILGLPANEIVVPVMVMIYMAQGQLTGMEDLAALKQILVGNGWTWVTALCTMTFAMMHWPCSTACLTMKKESQSLKWTAMAILVPTLWGLGVCFLIRCFANIFV